MGINSFEFSEDLLNGHITETIVGAPAAITWLEARFDGEPVVRDAKDFQNHQLFLSNISDSTSSFFEGILNSVTGSELGPGVTSDNITLDGLTGFLGNFIDLK